MVIPDLNFVIDWITLIDGGFTVGVLRFLPMVQGPLQIMFAFAVVEFVMQGLTYLLKGKFTSGGVTYRGDDAAAIKAAVHSATVSAVAAKEAALAVSFATNDGEDGPGMFDNLDDDD